MVLEQTHCMPDTTDSHAELSREGDETNLPLQLTSFVGREREISELEGLLAGGTRLLTLTGAGGSGKTRLARALASEVVGRFDDGVWWVELAPLADPDLVPQAVASVLRVQESSGGSLTEVIAEDLKDLKILLVLDNCEHLIGSCAELADALLRSSAGLAILATSREALGIAGEVTWSVPPLPFPDPHSLPTIEKLEHVESVRLFVERATYRVPGFALNEKDASSIAEICARLDGMPLAIELAAARVGTLSVESISERLEHSFNLLSGKDRTAPERQRTLRGALDWSYELLEEEERKVFGRLSVFAGGFTLEAAEAVCAGDGIEPEDVLDLLSRLVEKSLVSVVERDGEARYRLLATIRQYAAGKLDEPAELHQAQERHARYYLALAEEAERGLREQAAWLEKLETEQDNFRAVLGWTLEAEDAEGPAGEERAQLGFRLAVALAEGRFWNAYGIGEGRRWLQEGLTRSSVAPSLLRARALGHAGYLAIWQGDYQGSVALVEDSMTLFEELDDKPGLATSIFHLGNMALHGGDRERATALQQKAEALRRELSDRQAQGLLLYFLGFCALDDGDPERAATLAEEGMSLNMELGDLRGVAMCLTILGISALERNDRERAAAVYEEDLRTLRGLRDKAGTAYGLRGMAAVAAQRGDAGRAARLWGAAEAVSQAIGLPLSPFDRVHPDYEGLLDAVRPRLDEASWEAAREEGRAMTPEEAIEYALSTDEATPASPEKAPAPSSPLSEREAEILTLVAEGLTNPQIAHELYLSSRTVGQHLRSIYRKLGVSSRAAAVTEAFERGLI
jgi:predicted ATPase/DNA-binding CsgD family transcriptional regulator